MNPFEFLKNAIMPKPAEPLPEGALLIDVRSPVEFAGGSIHGAIHIPVDRIHLINAHKPKIDLCRPIVVFCASGMRSSSARRQLLSMGYETVINGGGISNLSIRLSNPNH
jgi:rhodanese-related sulfurtransferase